eukprot:scaffold180734_cov35-Tisochrysis_lutea.AAC.2
MVAAPGTPTSPRATRHSKPTRRRRMRKHARLASGRAKLRLYYGTSSNSVLGLSTRATRR